MMLAAAHGRPPDAIRTPLILILCNVVQHCTKLIAAAEGLVGQLPTHELARWYTLLADLQSQRAEQARSGTACKPGAWGITGLDQAHWPRAGRHMHRLQSARGLHVTCYQQVIY